METEEKDDEEEEEQPNCEGWGSPTDLWFHHIKKEKVHRMRKGQPD